MKKIYYNVTYSYCAGYLGIGKNFEKFSDAREYAKNAATDVDNTDIVIYEVTQTGIFKKKYNDKIIEIYNEIL